MSYLRQFLELTNNLMITTIILIHQINQNKIPTDNIKKQLVFNQVSVANRFRSMFRKLCA